MTTTITTGSFETRTVGEIVAEDWRAAAVFEQFGIDFCCGGRRSVADACRGAGIDARVVEEAIAALPDDASGDDPRHWTVDSLVDRIELTHHAYVRSSLPRVAAFLTKLVRVHGGRHPELVQISAKSEALGRELLQHMLKEERVLFPYIRELAMATRAAPSPFGTVENPIRMMEREHDEAGVLMHEIRTLTADYTPPADGCTTYRVCFEELARFERDLHRHVHLENNVLFPEAVALEAMRVD
jgi:regulator of cell morphogenesis and NO signaling